MKCLICNGNGKVAGCGYMMVDCDNCHGSGYVEDIDDEVEEIEEKPAKDLTRSEKMKAAWARRKAKEKYD